MAQDTLVAADSRLQGGPDEMLRMPWRLQSKILILINFFVSIACITTADLDKRLNAWVGSDADTLATAWGAPTGTYQKRNGERILTYEKSSIISSGPGPFIQTFSRHCRVDIFTDAHGKILRLHWIGDAGQCDRLALPPPGETLE